MKRRAKMPDFLRNRRRSLASHLFKLFYIAMTCALVHVAMGLAFQIYVRWFYDSSLGTIAASYRDYLRTLPFMIGATIIYTDLFGMTHFYRKLRRDIAAACLRYVALLAITTAAVAYFMYWFAFPRYVLAIGSVLLFLLVWIWSLIALALTGLIYAKGRILILASDRSDADHLYGKIAPELYALQLRYLGYTLLDDFLRVRPLIDRATEVLISSRISDADRSRTLLYCAETDKAAYVVPQFTDLAFARFRLIHFRDMPTFLIDRSGLTFQQRFLKRAFDIVFSFLSLLVTSPLQLVLAIIVKLDSPGPVFYRQERLTQDGRIYHANKFRTMVDQAEETYGAHQSGPEDPRVTKAGRILRNTHMDELPQFVNILAGDMSVVGPRSDRPVTIGEFVNAIPGYNQRLKVKAGLTGLAQIYGKYNSAPEDKLRYDMMYIKNYSFLLDMRIILQTFKEMLPFRNEITPQDLADRNREFTIE